MSTGTNATDRRISATQMAWYFGGLVTVYLAGVIGFWPTEGEDPSDAIFLVVMFAPTVGALCARWFAHARIQWGRPGAWMLAGLIPAVAVLLVYLLGSAVGWDTEDPTVLSAALAGALVPIVTASISALGEEIGWRGFLWPTLRTGSGFWRVSLVVAAIWWLYHVPLILLGWYGEVSGLPAFTVAIVGFTLFVGVLTDRARSVWPSMIAHGAWNGLVATSFAATEGGESVPAFSGSDALMGEFGWLAAVTMLIVGSLAAWWHTRNDPRRSQIEEPTRQA